MWMETKGLDKVWIMENEISEIRKGSQRKINLKCQIESMVMVMTTMMMMIMMWMLMLIVMLYLQVMM